MLADEERTFDVIILQMSKVLILIFEEYSGDFLLTFGMDGSFIYNEDGELDFENWRKTAKKKLVTSFQNETMQRIQEED